MTADNIDGWQGFAWAIELVPGTLAGRYYFAGPHPSHAGCEKALFRTRREAYAAKRGKPFCRRVVRVQIALGWWPA